MKSEQYWKNRAAQRMWEYMQSAEETADQAAKLYQKAAAYLSEEIDGIFEKYMTKHQLSEREAYELLDQMTDKTSLQELLQKLKNGAKDTEKKEIIQKLEAPAYRARIERLEQIQKQLDQIMQKVYQQEQILSTAHYAALAEKAYYRAVFDIQQRAGYEFSFSQLDQNVIDRLLKSKWSGKNYSTRIWNNTGALAQTLKEELLVSLVTGRTERETAEVIMLKFAQGSSQARRLIRTESSYITGQMDLHAYEECGIEKYVYLATLDLRTCQEDCAPLDGKIFLVKDAKPGKNMPPMHPWCRCTTIPYFSDEILRNMRRRARDPVTGKVSTVPGDMTYQKWYERYVEGNPEVEAKEKAGKNAAADREQYERYREILGKDMPKSFADFQEMKYNEPERWKLFQTYVHSVKNGMISPLSGFKNYEKLYGEINKNIVGVKTSEGTEVIGQSKHFMERVVGTMEDPKTGRPRSGVAVDGIRDALENPLKVLPIRTAPGGDKSQKYVGRDGTVAINPDSGVLIQCNPTDTDYMRRIENAKIQT